MCELAERIFLGETRSKVRFSMKSRESQKGIIAMLLIIALVGLVALAIRLALAPRHSMQTLAAQPKQQDTSLSQATESSPAAALEKIGKIPSQSDSPHWMVFVDEQNGWYADFQNLWRSSDGGRNWKLIFSNDDDLSALFFANRQVGWTKRVSGTYRSEDGGMTWKKVRTPNEYPEGMIRAIYFLSDGQTGWLGGGQYRRVSRERFLQESQPGYLVKDVGEPGGPAFLHQSILKTTDGGKTWRPQHLPDEIGVIFSLQFADNRRGVALGASSFLYTSDAGKRWSRAVLRPECVDPQFIKLPDSRPVTAAFADGRAWVSYDNGRLLTSTDGGESWCDLLRPEEVWASGEHDAYFRKLYFTSATTGWGLKANGTLFRTVDGGRVWTPIPLERARVNEMYSVLNYILVATDDMLVRLSP